MMCERCGKNPATIILKRTAGESTQELNLCEACVKSLPLFDVDMEEIIAQMANLDPNVMLKAIFDSQQQEQQTYENTMIACPNCHLTYEGFIKTGRLGCARCYDAFRVGLDAALKNIQGNNRHEGKIPRRSGTRIYVRRQIQGLREELSKAVISEEYEKAAALRDEIKELEAGDKDE